MYIHKLKVNHTFNNNPRVGGIMDDIDFLKAHSNQHAYQMYIDSAKRNRAVFSQPNYYKIEFNTPLKNVFSIQVLDASIPITHYNVDVHTNRLYFIFEDDTSQEQ